MILRISWLLARPGRAGLATVLLPVIAFATVTALLLIVLGGAQEFWTFPIEEDGLIYQLSAVLALTLLVFPLSNLAAAASRLSARRRDDRLATLRLLGATPSTVTAITVIESTVLAVLGALAGVVLYLASVPAVGLIPFRGEALGADAVLLPALAILGVVGGVAVLATVSAVLGLRRVIISPLVVRMRVDVPRPHWIRAVVAILVVATTYVVMGAVGAVELAMIMTVLAVGFGGTLLVLNLVGPWVLKVLARRQARRAATPHRLLAARGILESPRAAWAQVSGVAMTSFMAVFAGTAVGLAQVFGVDEQTEMLFTDIRTGVIITIVASFLIVACSAGVNQAASILDRKDLSVSLSRLGMDVATMESSRRLQIMGPLRVTTIGSAVIAGIVVFPLTGAALLFAPLTLLAIAVVLAAGIGLVQLGLVATRPILERVATPA